MDHWAKITLAAKGKQKPKDTAEDCTSSPDTMKKGAIDVSEGGKQPV
jgi:hypothetical protein